jgi:tetratricopeptide (TPR) repeat protein
MSRSSVVAVKRELKKSKSIKKVEVPTTPDGKKRCHNCDQPFALKKSVCPHCKAEYTVPLSDVDPTVAEDITDEQWVVFECEVKRLRTKTHLPESRAELIDLMFKRAMAVKYTQPKRSLELFLEVVALNSSHWEARIKVSWLMIKFNDFLTLIPYLEPIVDPESSATVEQRQRAYNNIVCSYMFRLPPDYITAEKLCRTGIALDPEGNVKLWENLGSALKFQGRLNEARDAFNIALQMEPTSSFSIKNIAALDQASRHKRKTGKKEVVVDKENVENSKKAKLFPSKSISFKKLRTVDRL